MITVSVQNAVLLYLALMLLLFFGTWARNHLRERSKKPLDHLYGLRTCEFCHYSYLTLTTQKVHRCPQCTSLNK